MLPGRLAGETRASVSQWEDRYVRVSWVLSEAGPGAAMTDAVVLWQMVLLLPLPGSWGQRLMRDPRR